MKSALKMKKTQYLLKSDNKLRTYIRFLDVKHDVLTIFAIFKKMPFFGKIAIYQRIRIQDTFGS
jgi:hypothetical protein